MKTLITFMCFLRELGCVYDLSHTLQMYGLSDVCTCMCFFLSLLLAKRLSQPSNSHLNGFSPGGLNKHRELPLNGPHKQTPIVTPTVNPKTQDVNCLQPII